jgi:hypothetical protein
MKHHFKTIAIAVAVLLSCSAKAQNEIPLTRDEVTVIKKKLVNILDALGQAQPGYSVENERFDLPTQASKNTSSGLYYSVDGGAERKYGTQKKAEKETGDLQKEYEKKMLDAQAKGDYQAMTKLAQEMQQKAAASQKKAVEEKKEPIEVNVRFNSGGGGTIDPDAVLLEHPGVIALKSANEGSQGQERVYVYFDPVSLKETKQLSRVDMKMPQDGSARKTAVLNVTIEMSGPATEIEPWAKRIDTKKVLSQIDPAK